ncbi:MAG: transposase [bacterium]
MGEVQGKIPRDRNAEFKTRVIPHSKRYEHTIVQIIGLMFLTGVGTRTLSIHGVTLKCLRYVEFF